MSKFFFTSKLIFLLTFSFVQIALQAQSDIKINDIKINHLDKQKRKQGDWIFFDKDGNVRLSCFFKDDKNISPLVFYENSDTIFLRLPPNKNKEAFILFDNTKTYAGNLVHTSDSTTIIELDTDSTLSDNIILEIKKYQNLTIEPFYFFSQKKLIDYISASFTSSNFIFNKTLNILLTISSSGIITKVEFPKDKNNLSVDEETELHWIYSTMPRWQPYFWKNSAISVKVLLTNNSTLSLLSFEN